MSKQRLGSIAVFAQRTAIAHHRLHSHPVQHLVAETKRRGFTRRQPSLVLDHLPELTIVDLGRLALVGGDDGFQRLVQHLGHLAQIVGIAAGPGPGVVDHQHGIGSHLQPMRAAGRHACRTRRQCIDAGGTALAQAVEHVVDRQSVE